MERRLNDPRLRRQRRRQPMRQPQRQPQQRPQRGLNENYARELMELHTLGVDGGYTQTGRHRRRARLTGWTIDRPQQGGGVRVPAADARRRREGRARHEVHGAAARTRASACSTCSHASVHGAPHRVQAGAALRRRRAAGGAGRSRGEEVPRHQGRPARSDATSSSRRRSSSPPTRIAPR